MEFRKVASRDEAIRFFSKAAAGGPHEIEPSELEFSVMVGEQEAAMIDRSSCRTEHVEDTRTP